MCITAPMVWNKILVEKLFKSGLKQGNKATVLWNHLWWPTFMDFGDFTVLLGM